MRGAQQHVSCTEKARGQPQSLQCICHTECHEYHSTPIIQQPSLKLPNWKLTHSTLIIQQPSLKLPNWKPTHSTLIIQQPSLKLPNWKLPVFNRHPIETFKIINQINDFQVWWAFLFLLFFPLFFSSSPDKMWNAEQNCMLNTTKFTFTTELHRQRMHFLQS